MGQNTTRRGKLRKVKARIKALLYHIHLKKLYISVPKQTSSGTDSNSAVEAEHHQISIIIPKSPLNIPYPTSTNYSSLPTSSIIPQLRVNIANRPSIPHTPPLTTSPATVPNTTLQLFPLQTTLIFSRSSLRREALQALYFRG